MKPLSIPVRVVGPGSQPPEDEPLNVLPFTAPLAGGAMPRIPDAADPRALARVRAVLAEFAQTLESWDGAGHPSLNLERLDEATIDALNEVLGSGEVSIRLRTDGEIRIQETVFAGVWRVLRYRAGGALTADALVAAPIPQVVIDVARAAASTGLPPIDMPPGAMNSPALMTEIRDNVRRRNGRTNGHAVGPAHVINLSLLPLTPADHDALNRALPVGPVAIMSKSFGNCRVTSTGTRDVWRVQYFNSMQTLILNTIEIVDLPEVALASDDDLADSRTRLDELIAWLDEAGTS